LRQYYDDVKTKRQLQMEMPAGFRRSSEFQKSSLISSQSATSG